MAVACAVLAACGDGPAEPEVTAAVVASVTVTSPSETLPFGTRTQFEVVVLDANGNVLSDATIAWGASPPTIGRMSSQGVLTAVALGSVTVTATAAAGGVSNSADVEITPLHFTSVEVGAPSNGVTCSITTQGAAYCWGMNFSAQLGIGIWAGADASFLILEPGYGFRVHPMAVASELTWSSVVPGSEHTCGVTTAGSAYCWGWRAGGALGIGDSFGLLVTSSSSFLAAPETEVLGSLTHASLTTLSHSCTVTTEGSAYCWGPGGWGQLGTGISPDLLNDDTGSSNVPVAVAGGMTFTTLGAGDRYTCGLVVGGTAYCWGTDRDNMGVLGAPSLARCFQSPCSTTPTEVSGQHNFEVLSAGSLHTCGIDVSGAALCWGANIDGQLGDGTVVPKKAPVLVAGGLTFVSISAGVVHTCGVTNTSEVYCWGREAGIPEGVIQAEPVQVGGDLRFTSVSASEHTCGISTGEVVYCWGLNTYGGLGDGTTEDRAAPVQVRGQFVAPPSGR